MSERAHVTRRELMLSTTAEHHATHLHRLRHQPKRRAGQEQRHRGPKTEHAAAMVRYFCRRYRITDQQRPQQPETDKAKLKQLHDVRRQARHAPTRLAEHGPTEFSQRRLRDRNEGEETGQKVKTKVREPDAKTERD